MKEIKCLVVDDEPLAINLLEKHIQKFSQLTLKGSCWNAIQAFEILKNEAIDLVFLDIQMPGLNGIDFVKSLKEKPSIIFTTAYRDYAVESYELDVIDYLLKPITFERFFKAVNKYFDRIENDSEKIQHIKDNEVEEASSIYVNTNRKHTKVVFDNISYVESLKDYIKIYINEEVIITKEKISEFEKKLPHYFLRIHRSFIVNTQKITAFTQQDIEIEEKEIPIGISYKKEVISFLKK